MDDTNNPKDFDDNKLVWNESPYVPEEIIQEELNGGTNNPAAESDKSHLEQLSTPSVEGISNVTNKGNSPEEDARLSSVRAELSQLSADARPALFFNKAPRWVNTKVENWAAKFRGKSNELVTDREGNFEGMFSKHATKVDGQRDNVEGLKREYHFLDELRDSGVTPEPVMLKIAPDGSEARLLMEKVSGKALEEVDCTQDFMKDRFTDIVISTRTALDTVHEHGVAVVDINEGTFVIDGLDSPGTPLVTHIVDFELSADIEHLMSGESLADLTRIYSSKDKGFAVASQSGEATLAADVIKKIEHHIAAKEIVQRYVGLGVFDVNKLSSQDRSKYDEQLQRLKPDLEARRRQYLHESYERAKARKSEYIPETEELYIEQNLDTELSFDINEAMLNITAPYSLEEKGIKVEPEVLSVLQQDLSPFIADRAA